MSGIYWLKGKCGFMTDLLRFHDLGNGQISMLHSITDLDLSRFIHNNSFSTYLLLEHYKRVYFTGVRISSIPTNYKTRAKVHPIYSTKECLIKIKLSFWEILTLQLFSILDLSRSFQINWCQVIKNNSRWVTAVIAESLSRKIEILWNLVIIIYTCIYPENPLVLIRLRYVIENTLESTSIPF